MILDRNKKYHFRILFGVNVDTIIKIADFEPEITAVRLFSSEFNSLKAEVSGFDHILSEEFDAANAFHVDDLIVILYGEMLKIESFCNFLMIVRPAKISNWITFDTYYVENDGQPSADDPHETSGYSVWHHIHRLVDIEAEDIFYLTKKDLEFAGRLLPEFEKLCQNKIVGDFLTLYKRSYVEEDKYFMFLLLFMTVESLIKDDEKTGVVFKVRRLCAVLAGGDPDTCEIIFQRIGKAYNNRSDLVHGGKFQLSKSRLLELLHCVVCEIGISLLLMQPESDIFRKTIALGFGQRQRLYRVLGFDEYEGIFKNLSVIYEDETKKDLGKS